MNRSELPELTQTPDDHSKALTEMAFLVDVLSFTIEDLMGGAVATVGRTAGKGMAAKMPLYLPDSNLETVLATLQKHMSHGFEMAYQCNDTGADVSYRRCVIRDLCKVRGLKLGGQLCKVYHLYMSGIIEGVLGRPVIERMSEAKEEECLTTVVLR